MTEQERTYRFIISADLPCLGWRRMSFRGKKTHYFINTFGDIYHEKTQKILSKWYNDCGYVMASLTIDGVGYSVSVHRLVAQTFIPNPDKKPVVNHIDGNKKNNYVANLEWVTSKENTAHAIKMGLFNPKDKSVKARGINSGKNKYSEESIHRVCSLLELGYGPTQISRMTEVDLKSVDSILRKHNWVAISSMYNIPGPRHRIPMDPNVRIKVQTLVLDGLTTSEIMNKLGMDKANKYLYEQVAWERRKLKSNKQ